MAKVLLTKRIEFSASHRYHNDAWDAERNRVVFGACNHEPGHGHNYLLEVTVAGEVDADTGMVVNLYDLKQVLKQVLEEFDHKHLNLDTPYFKGKIPTTENIAGVLWRMLAARPEIGPLEKVRLFEDEDLFAEITAADVGGGGPEIARASVTRRYYFSAAHRVHSGQLSAAENRRLYGKCDSPNAHGHNYELSVRVRGKINPDTGMVTDIPTLDRLVQELVVQRFDHQDLNRDPDFSAHVPTGENLTRLIWKRLAGSIPAARLDRIGLVETRGSSYSYAGETGEGALPGRGAA
ncbi:MAG: 6-carboxytetrahydropterin synthase [Nitrospiraceae bacterium]